MWRLDGPVLIFEFNLSPFIRAFGLQSASHRIWEGKRGMSKAAAVLLLLGVAVCSVSYFVLTDRKAVVQK